MRPHDAAPASGARMRAEIEVLGLHAAETLRSRRAIVAARAAFSAAAPWTLVAPLCALAAFVAGLELPVGWIVACTLLPVVAFVFVASARVLGVPVDARHGLARIDAELDAHDALRTAHDFLGRDARGAFEEAAIADACGVLSRARTHEIAADGPCAALPRRAWALPLAALLVSAFLAWNSRPEVAPELPQLARTTPASTLGAHAPDRQDEAAKPAGEASALPREVHAQHGADTAPSAKSEEHGSRDDRERAPRETTGQNGEGRSADASPASNPSESQGVPSSQSQPSTNAETSRAKARTPKPPAPAPAIDPSRKKPAHESGATAGRGSGSGSSKNPGATDWASKDQVSTDEETPPTEDADVDDENEESEARGGLQPNLRDRRPAVNRDLTIGFGNQKDPDANGRGGPSEQKKSRGVASLVLGVPLPDHVKGQPNPGRTKITQERVEPRAQDALVVQASARTARSDRIGTLPRRELTPWMRTLVRDYFLTLRRNPKTSP